MHGDALLVLRPRHHLPHRRHADLDQRALRHALAQVARPLARGREDPRRVVGERAAHREPGRGAREGARRPGARLETAMSMWNRDDPWRNPHRLYRDTENARVAGVCAGIADFFGIRRRAVRLAAVLCLIFFFVPTALTYVAL